MPHPDFEDLSDFFDPDEFATQAVITREGEKVAEVLGIFDDPKEVASIGEYDMDHLTPRFTCAEVEVAGIEAKDIATIKGKPFDIMESPQLDGTGLAVLILGTPNVVYNAGL